MDEEKERERECERASEQEREHTRTREQESARTRTKESRSVRGYRVTTHKAAADTRNLA